jgi:hypothetical protein
LSAGVHTFAFDYRRVAAQNSTIGIRRMRVEIWRVN